MLHQLRSQKPGFLEVMRVHADVTCRFDVFFRVVNEEAVAGLKAISVKKNPVDPWVRLDQVFLGRHNDVAETVIDERKPFPGFCEFLIREIGDRIKRTARFLQFA